MFNVDDDFSSNEADGVWTDYSESRFLIASMNNVDFQRFFAKLQRPYHKQIERNKLDPAIALDIMLKAMSKYILLDWRNVVDSAGNEVAYSVEAAASVLKKNSVFRDFVQDIAMDNENYRAEVTEEMGKSLKSVSNMT